MCLPTCLEGNLKLSTYRLHFLRTLQCNYMETKPLQKSLIRVHIREQWRPGFNQFDTAASECYPQSFTCVALAIFMARTGSIRPTHSVLPWLYIFRAGPSHMDIDIHSKRLLLALESRLMRSHMIYNWLILKKNTRLRSSGLYKPYCPI